MKVVLSLCEIPDWVNLPRFKKLSTSNLLNRDDANTLEAASPSPGFQKPGADKIWHGSATLLSSKDSTII